MSLNANSISVAAPVIPQLEPVPLSVGTHAQRFDTVDDKLEDRIAAFKSPHAEKLAAIKKTVNIPGGPPLHPQLVPVQDAILGVAAFCADPTLDAKIINHAKNRARTKATNDHCLTGKYERHAAQRAYLKDKRPKTRRFTRWTSEAIGGVLAAGTFALINLPILGLAIADARSYKRIKDEMTAKQVRKHEVARQLHGAEQSLRKFRKSLNAMQLVAEAPEAVLRASGEAARHMYTTVLVPACESLPEEAGKTADVRAALFGVRHQIDKLDLALKGL